jgi:hypothetical protein
MEFTLAYESKSSLSVLDGSTEVRFAPNIRRRPVYFEGGLRDPLLFRDALLCLHDLIVSDFDTRLTAEDWDRILDPVVTVARDEVFFEAFSQDESSYGRVALKPEMIGAFEEWQGGTTNVDFTPALAEAIAGIRTGERTGLRVEKEGFAVRTGQGMAREKKVKVPDSWLRGFLNVQAAMCFPQRSLELGRADLRNILAFLRSHREREGPRSLVLRLQPGRKVEALFEPWNTVIPLPQSVYQGDDEVEVRLWGRRRLALLNRLIPKTQRLTVYLLGSGYPSFWLADLGMVTFTLGISGWTVRPFASSGLSLTAPHAIIEPATLAAIWRHLQQQERAGADELAMMLQLSPAVVATGLALLCEQGKAMYDLEARQYRWREVADTPLDDLKIESSHQRQADAETLFKTGKVQLGRASMEAGNIAVAGSVRGSQGDYAVALTVDTDGRIVDGDCECTWFRYNHLRGGPCKHLLAMALVHRQAGGS